MKSELLNAAEDLNEEFVSSETEEIDAVSDDEDSLDGFDNETTPEAAFASVVDCIDRLFRLSMKVRNPALRTGLSKGYAFSKLTRTPVWICLIVLQTATLMAKMSRISCRLTIQVEVGPMYQSRISLPAWRRLIINVAVNLPIGASID